LSPLRFSGWTLKRYSIRYGDAPFQPTRFDAGRALAMGTLPSPAVAPGRIGMGFLIEHQGNRVDYVVLGWWDRDNELPLRVFVRDEGQQWRAGRGTESVCVWDLQVVWAERQAYVATVMRGMTPEAYATHDTLAVIGHLQAVHSA
jgi:hypothetical protein